MISQETACQGDLACVAGVFSRGGGEGSSIGNGGMETKMKKVCKNKSVQKWKNVWNVWNV